MLANLVLLFADLFFTDSDLFSNAHKNKHVQHLYCHNSFWLSLFSARIFFMESKLRLIESSILRWCEKSSKNIFKCCLYLRKLLEIGFCLLVLIFFSNSERFIAVRPSGSRREAILYLLFRNLLTSLCETFYGRIGLCSLLISQN